MDPYGLSAMESVYKEAWWLQIGRMILTVIWKRRIKYCLYISFFMLIFKNRHNIIWNTQEKNISLIHSGYQYDTLIVFGLMILQQDSQFSLGGYSCKFNFQKLFQASHMIFTKLFVTSIHTFGMWNDNFLIEGR